MQLIANGHTVTLDSPPYGYEVEYASSLFVSELQSRYRFFDPGIEHDHRFLTIRKQDISETAMQGISWFFSGRSRCEDIMLRLGNAPTGFFPGGPDRGDVGDFTLRTISDTHSGILTKPFRYFQGDYVFVLTQSPTYNLAAIKPEGNITIGTLSNAFRYPQNDFRPNIKYAKNQVLTTNGTPYDIDNGSLGDMTTTNFTIDTCAVNMGHLLNTLRTSRGGAISFSVQSRHYPFGAAVSPSAFTSYLVHCVNNSFKITHNGYDNFSMPLKFWLGAYV